MRFYLIFLPIVFLYLTGCTSTQKLQEYKEGRSTCSATLEGNLFESDKWPGDAPLLVERTVGRNFEYRKGRILELTDEGVLFDENRRSMANNPEPKFYSFNEIHSLIDSTGTLIQGEFPDSRLRTDTYEFYLNKFGPEGGRFKFNIAPDKPFHYCIDPGEYELRAVIWKRQDGNSDITSPYYFLGHTMVIENDRANYLGNIYVNISDQHLLASHYEFLMQAYERPNKNFYYYGQSSLFFSFAGIVLTEVMRDRGIVAVLDVQIVDDLKYKSVTGYPVRFTEIY